MPVTLRGTLPRPSSIKLTDKALMREVGQMAIRAIQARTRQGRDVKGQSFAPYSPAYEKRKADAGVGTGTVNLTVSGDMLNALQIVELKDDSVTLGWLR